MFARRFGTHLRRFRAAYAVLLLASTMTVTSVVVLQRMAHRHEVVWLAGLADEVAERARNRIEPSLGLLRGIRGLFLGSVEVEPDEFAEFVGVQLPQLRAATAVVYAEATPGHVTIRYVDPLRRRLDLIGYDLAADLVRSRALHAAEKTAEPVASTGSTFWIFQHIPASSGAHPQKRVGRLAGFAAIEHRSDLLWTNLIPGAKRALIGYELRSLGPLGVAGDRYAEGPLRRSSRTVETTVRFEVAGASWSLHLVVLSKAVDPLWWLPWLLAIVGAAASGLLFALMCVQIAARRSAEHLNELRDEFLSAAAHELKTPVTAIKGYSQLLREWDVDQVKRRGAPALEKIERQADRINRLVQEMLEASRIQRHQLRLSPEPFELVALVRAIVDDLAPTLTGHHILVTSDGDTSVVADRARIEEVVTNLVTNAAKFSLAGGDIRVHVRGEAGAVTTSVQDHGIGIPAARQRSIFQRYYQAHRGTAFEAIGGLGLGLYVTKEIVGAHGGDIWFESVEHQGTTFSFRLPRQPKEQAS